MKRILNTCLFFAAILGFTSCAPTLNVTSDYNHSANFSNYKTFGIYQLPDKSQSVSQLNQGRIMSAVKAQMMAKGFTESSSNPDLLVNVTAVKTNQEGLQANTMGAGGMYGYGGYYRPYGYGGMGGMSTTTVTFTNTITGSVIIDIVDAAKNEVVWTGTGNKEIDKPSQNPEQDISAAITKIMASFPPGVAQPKK